MDFVKDVWNLDIFDRTPKYACALFACFFLLQFNVFFEIFSTHLTLIWFKCFFTHEKTLLWGYTCNVCGKNFKNKWYIEKHFIKSTYIILVPSQRYQDFWQLLQNPKFPKNVLGCSNHAQRFNPPYYLDVNNPWAS